MSNTTIFKRKRSQKTVRFNEELPVIIDTYSPLDYDRGSIFSFPATPIQYKINPNITIPSLSLSIPHCSPCDSEDSSPDSEQTPELLSPSSPLPQKNNKKPKLTVNTSICSSGGPLFFTKLSTHHSKNDTTEDDYLVPITPQLTTAFPL